MSFEFLSGLLDAVAIAIVDKGAGVNTVGNRYHPVLHIPGDGQMSSTGFNLTPRHFSSRISFATCLETNISLNPSPPNHSNDS